MIDAPGLQSRGIFRFDRAMFADLAGKRVTVIGLGRFGGGVGAVQFLVARGARVTVTDRAGADTLADSLDRIAGLPLERLRLGGHDAADVLNAELVVASPAIPADAPLLVAAEAAGVPVTTEIGLFWSHCRGKIIGVTGSVGKSTTTAMIHAVLQHAGRTAWLGGNIGISLLPMVDRIGPDDWVVLELSSFQLERLASLKPQPRVAVVTSFCQNHLDRHGGLDAYRAAKQNLLRWQTVDDIAVLNVGDADVAGWPTNAQRWWFGIPQDDATLSHLASKCPPDALARSRRQRWKDWLCRTHAEGSLASRTSDRTPPAVLALSSDGAFLVHDGQGPSLAFLDLLLPGEHNRHNAAAALAATTAVGIDLAIATDALNRFRTLPHRLEVLGDFDGRLWVNDSKATAPESTVAALDAFPGRVHLIAGGADKCVDFSGLADAIIRRAASVSLSGQTGPMIAGLLAARGWNRFTLCSSFDETVRAAHCESVAGDVILLSPACASWGQFCDFRERGERFRQLAERSATPHTRPETS